MFCCTSVRFEPLINIDRGDIYSYTHLYLGYEAPNGNLMKYLSWLGCLWVLSYAVWGSSTRLPEREQNRKLVSMSRNRRIHSRKCIIYNLSKHDMVGNSFTLYSWFGRRSSSISVRKEQRKERKYRNN